MHDYLNSSREAKSDSVFLVLILLGLFLAVGVLFGSIFSKPIKKGIVSLFARQRESVPTVTAAAPLSAPEHLNSKQLDELRKELIERVNDSRSSLNALITLTSVIVALIGVAFGASIWQTKKYAAHLIRSSFDSHFANVKKEVERLLVEKKKELQNAQAASIESLLEAYKIMCDSISQEMRQLDEAELASTKNDKQRTYMLRDRAMKREMQYARSHYVICLMSHNEDVVVNAAQQLAGMGDEAAIPYLNRALDHSRPDTAARSAIQQAIKEIQRKKQQRSR